MAEITITVTDALKVALENEVTPYIQSQGNFANFKKATKAYWRAEVLSARQWGIDQAAQKASIADLAGDE